MISAGVQIVLGYGMEFATPLILTPINSLSWGVGRGRD